MIACGFAPFWWRFWQCINKYYYSKQKVNLLNALKYTSKLLVPLVVLLLPPGSNKAKSESFLIWFAFQMVATIYCLIWDYYMDWGVFRSKAPGKYCLRDKITYEPKYYYIAMVINFILRFWWLIGIFELSLGTSSFAVAFKELEILAFLGLFAEITRRAIWSLFRVENEFHNNFENYRSVPTIPAM